jgi:hypothetical protein
MKLQPRTKRSRNLLGWMSFLDVGDFDNIASAMRIPAASVALASRRAAITALREVASLRFLRIGAAALATLRKLKRKPAYHRQP